MNKGDHVWFSPWNELWKKYGVVLHVETHSNKVQVRLVDGQEIWVEDFELSQGVVEDE